MIILGSKTALFLYALGISMAIAGWFYNSFLIFSFAVIFIVSIILTIMGE